MALADCAANRSHNLLAVVAEGTAQGVSPGHRIVAAPVGVDHVLGGGPGKRWVTGAQLGQRLRRGAELGPDRAALAPDGRPIAQQDLAAGVEQPGQLAWRDQRQLVRLRLLEATFWPDVGSARSRVDTSDDGLLPLPKQLDHVPLAVGLDHDGAGFANRFGRSAPGSGTWVHCRYAAGIRRRAGRGRSMPGSQPAASRCRTSTSMNVTHGAAWQARRPTLTPGQLDQLFDRLLHRRGGRASRAAATTLPSPTAPAPCRGRWLRLPLCRAPGGRLAWHRAAGAAAGRASPDPAAEGRFRRPRSCRSPRRRRRKPRISSRNAAQSQHRLLTDVPPQAASERRSSIQSRTSPSR